MPKLLHAAIIEEVIEQSVVTDKQKENALHSLNCILKQNEEIKEQKEKLEKIINFLKRKLTFRYDRDILEIVKDPFLKKSPKLRVMSNYEEDELIKEVLVDENNL